MEYYNNWAHYSCNLVFLPLKIHVKIIESHKLPRFPVQTNYSNKNRSPRKSRKKNKLKIKFYLVDSWIISCARFLRKNKESIGEIGNQSEIKAKSEYAKGTMGKSLNYARNASRRHTHRTYFGVWCLGLKDLQGSKENGTRSRLHEMSKRVRVQVKGETWKKNKKYRY